ncbi:DUF6597 domain-containing transcriptional factor [Tenacibaculum sp. M341]|uniref:DUF6597 domain-containing transcriptional factor n=1 Tax=Tenacibaculum sp. M341 TaxID=2530339 RepID=UPI00104798BC|nr:DUF6597 domain-containing transcriptional factor [Tenacibaculum sp. M341]TCI93055.1 AraC family transcriptional regulator [Tenacibaculum sp. M341]
MELFKINDTGLGVDMLIPKDNLYQFIDSFWLFNNNNNTPINYSIVPDGFFKLIVIYVNKNIHQVKLVGLFDKTIPVTTPANSTTFLIKFKLLASEYIFNHKIGILLNNREELDYTFWNINQFTGKSIEGFIKHIKENCSNFDTIKTKIPQKKKKLSELIYSTYSLNNVTSIVNQLDWSQRQINRYLKKHIGVSIKEYLNILKFADTYNQISKGELFPNGNFTDQSHFSKSIKKQTGTTPQKLYEGQNDQFIQLQLTNKT